MIVMCIDMFVSHCISLTQMGFKPVVTLSVNKLYSWVIDDNLLLINIYLFTVIYIAHFPWFNAQMRCTGYEMARYNGTQASHLYEKSMHTICTISEQPLLAEASTILDRSLKQLLYYSVDRYKCVFW